MGGSPRRKKAEHDADEGEVLDVLVQKRRNTKAAMRLFRKLLKNTGVVPERIHTDRLASYRAAARELGITRRHRPGRMIGNNRAENSHLPIRRARAQTTEVQVSGFSPEIPRHPRSLLQHLQYSASPDHQTNASPPSMRRVQNLADGDRRGMTAAPCPELLRTYRVALTAPTTLLCRISTCES